MTRPVPTAPMRQGDARLPAAGLLRQAGGALGALRAPPAAPAPPRRPRGEKFVVKIKPGVQSPSSQPIPESWDLKWVKTSGIPFWLVGEFTHLRTDFSGWIGMFTGGTIWIAT